MKLKFGIESWDAWLPGVRDKSEWLEALSSQKSVEPTDLSKKTDYRYLKPRQRRRLSDISKITLDVAFGAISEHQQVSTVFASRRGEVGRMAGLLRDICAEEDASPTAFSLSVHNTASGLFSIQSNNHAPSTAVAAGHDTVAAAFIEACSQLACGKDRVLLVISEDIMPQVYQCFSDKNEQPVAAAFLLTPEEQFCIETNLSAISFDSQQLATSAQIMQLMNLIINQQPALIAGERMPCKIHPVIE